MRWGFFGWGRGGWVLRLWRSCFVTCMQRFFYIYLPGKNRLNTFADDARLYLGVSVQPIKSWLSVPSPCFPPLKKISYLRCCGDCAVPPPKRRDVAETLPSLALTALHCCVGSLPALKVQGWRAQQGTPNVLCRPATAAHRQSVTVATLVLRCNNRQEV